MARELAPADAATREAASVPWLGLSTVRLLATAVTLLVLVTLVVSRSATAVDPDAGRVPTAGVVEQGRVSRP